MREQTTLSRVLSGQKDSKSYTIYTIRYIIIRHIYTNQNKTLNETKIDFRKM